MKPDETEAQIATLEAEIAALKKASQAEPPFKSDRPREPTDYLARVAVLPPNVVEDMARAVPTSLVKDIVADHRRALPTAAPVPTERGSSVVGGDG
jgi:hypothetical protein